MNKPEICEGECIRGDHRIRCVQPTGHEGDHSSLDGRGGIVRWANAPKIFRQDEVEMVDDQTIRLAEGRKYDAGKPRWDLLPWKALSDVVDVLTYGAHKYEPENWRKVDGWRWRYARAAIGHIVSWMRGVERDAESELPHLAHACCCILFLLELDR